jgi:hypothetical protein
VTGLRFHDQQSVGGSERDWTVSDPSRNKIAFTGRDPHFVATLDFEGKISTATDEQLILLVLVPIEPPIEPNQPDDRVIDPHKVHRLPRLGHLSNEIID